MAIKHLLQILVIMSRTKSLEQLEKTPLTTLRAANHFT